MCCASEFIHWLDWLLSAFEVSLSFTGEAYDGCLLYLHSDWHRLDWTGMDRTSVKTPLAWSFTFYRFWVNMSQVTYMRTRSTYERMMLTTAEGI